MNNIAIVGVTAKEMLNFRGSLLAYLSQQGFRVYAFATDYTDRTKAKVLALGAVPVDYPLCRSGLNPLADMFAMVQLRRLFKQYKIDIVFSYMAKPVIWATLAAFFAGIKHRYGLLEGLGYAFTPHARQSKKAVGIKWIQVLLYKITLPILENLIFLNQDDPIDLLEKYNIAVKKYTVLTGIGVDLQKFSYAPLPAMDKGIVFLFMGRLLREKGIFEFVAAAQEVKKQYQNTQFIVLGDIDLENPGSLTKNELDHLIRMGVITYVGYSEEVISWIQKSHVFVLPSYREGMPRSTQEAMAIGRAVITTDVPGCRETVIPEKNGLLIEKENSNALKEAIIKLISNPEMIAKMSVCSRQLAEEKFDAEKINAAIKNMILTRLK